MNEIITQRIDTVHRGEVPEGYHIEFGYLIPDEWKTIPMNNRFTRSVSKNKSGCDNVLTISAQMGLVNQREFYDKDIASEDKSGYFLLKNGEFAYNKSYSTGYPYGAIKQLTKYNEGIVSPLYICFSPKVETNTAFYTQYFEGGQYNREIYRIAQEGARNHGLLNIAVEDFFAGTLIDPPLAEQQKIAEILSTCDRVIELKQQLLDEKRRQKQWLMRSLLSKAQDINEIKLSDLCSLICDGDWIESKDQSESGIRLVQTGNVGIGQYLDKDGRARYISEETFDRLHCTEIFEGDVLISRLPDPIGRACRIPKLSTRAITAVDCSILRFKDEQIAEFFLQYATSQDYFNKISILAGGSTRTRISRKEIEKLTVPVPADKSSMVAISVKLSLADREILLLEQELEEWQQKKKALMQLLLTGLVRVNA